MRKLDYNFHNKHIVRHIMMNKINIINTHAIPNISKLIFTFNLNRLDDIDDVQVYNYIYLFKFFFGKIAYLTRLRSYYSLGK